MSAALLLITFEPSGHRYFAVLLVLSAGAFVFWLVDARRRRLTRTDVPRV